MPERDWQSEIDPRKIFAGMDPEDWGACLACLVRLDRFLNLDAVKSHARAGGADADRCQQRWRQENRRELARLKRAYEAGHPIAVYDALALARDTGMPPPRWALNVAVHDGARRVCGEQEKRRRGRYSSATARQDKMVRNWVCHWLVVYLRAHNPDDPSWKRAMIEAAEWMKMKPDAVRKAFHHVEDGTAYLSETLALLR